MDGVVGLNVALVGCGSIGGQHLRALLDREDIAHIDVMTGNAGCLDGVDASQRTSIVRELDSTQYDFAVVASTTERHRSDALALVERGVPVLVEKPMAATVADARDLANAAEEQGVLLAVGYNMRFLPAVGRVFELLAEGAIGQPLFGRAEVGQRLSQWRPEADYRLSYSADPSRGGGVALDLSHEVDLMHRLFGLPEYWCTLKANTGHLGIESEEVFEGVYRWPTGLTFTVHADYLELQKRRRLRVVGSEGAILCDFVEGLIEVAREETVDVTADGDLFDTANALRDEHDAFVRSIDQGELEAPLCSPQDGLVAVTLLEDFHV